MGNSVSDSLLENKKDKKPRPEYLKINLEFGERLHSGVIGIIYIWDADNKAVIKNFEIKTEATPLEIVMQAAKEISYTPALIEGLKFSLTITKEGDCSDRNSLRPLESPLEDITKVANENTKENIWDFGARENCTVQVAIRKLT